MTHKNGSPANFAESFNELQRAFLRSMRDLSVVEAKVLNEGLWNLYAESPSGWRRIFRGAEGAKD